jgi:hypothetical protein
MYFRKSGGNQAENLCGCSPLLKRLVAVTSSLVKLPLQVGNRCASGWHLAGLAPNRAPLSRFPASTASLHVAPSGGPRRWQILCKSWVSRHVPECPLWVGCGHQKRVGAKSALTPKADIKGRTSGVRFVPIADMRL